MNFGFNSNVRVAEALYHVQTEDRGPSHPFLDTVVYEAGRVVYKQSTSYADFAAATASQGLDLAQQLHERLSRQHHDVIAQLEAGTLNLHAKENVPSSPQPEPEVSDGLDVRLANPKAWLDSGNVTLEIELRRRKNNQPVEDAEVEAFVERERQRTHCQVSQTDADGNVTLRFPMPHVAGDGASLVIRATDGSLYGELRFHLKPRPSGPVPAPVSK
ncbi:MAG: DUF4198 domain-containing protein [Acidobacteriia bacterium]|nr:DUF4198 domain-containing protein [Terriglobia bacterium]